MTPVQASGPSSAQGMNQPQPYVDPRMANMQGQMDFSKIDPQTLAAAMILVQNAQQGAPREVTSQPIKYANKKGEIIGFYEGELRNGLPHGRGTVGYSKELGYVGSCKGYQGEFANGFPHGVGKMLYDGVYFVAYEGEFQENEQCGRGQMRYADGDVYDGEWRESMRHGRGVMSYVDGWRYDGMWVDNKRQGQCTITRTGSVISYTGGFENGKYHGEGTLRDANLRTRQGEFRNGKLWNGHNDRQLIVNGRVRGQCHLCTIL